MGVGEPPAVSTVSIGRGDGDGLGVSVGVAVFCCVGEGTAVFVAVGGTAVGELSARISVGAMTTPEDTGTTAAGCCRQEMIKRTGKTNQISRCNWGIRIFNGRIVELVTCLYCAATRGDSTKIHNSLFNN